ncbi:hypothetical protein ABEB36_013864 [Hypothenemus hampei]|uniref:Uncharacterized protein n=1 Tax=Hypothenemus hampei TaxID=57062 RepID=A0ABD1E5H6_HYPHA
MPSLIFKIIFLFSIMELALTVVIDGGVTVIGPDEPGTLLKGPASRASVKGPSGPIILANEDTGAVSASRISGGVVSQGLQNSGDIVEVVPVVSAPVVPSAAVPLIPIQAPLQLNNLYH